MEEARRVAPLRERLFVAADNLDQSIMRLAKDTVESVLKYFERFERMARLRNDRMTAQHFEQCWVTMSETFYGRVEVYRAPLLATVGPVSEAPRSVRRPRWFIEKNSHPMRKVVSQRRNGMTLHYKLSCGHHGDEIGIQPDSPPARRRRCKVCKPEKRKAARK